MNNLPLGKGSITTLMAPTAVIPTRTHRKAMAFRKDRGRSNSSIVSHYSRPIICKNRKIGMKKQWFAKWYNVQSSIRFLLYKMETMILFWRRFNLNWKLSKYFKISKIRSIPRWVHPIHLPNSIIQVSKWVRLISSAFAFMNNNWKKLNHLNLNIVRISKITR